MVDLVDPTAVKRGWDAAVAVPAWDADPVWLHGDLHPANHPLLSRIGLRTISAVLA
ncbi:MAG TPA: hypothetical protein VFZ72_01795 [Jiangellaceae bacterium]